MRANHSLSFGIFLTLAITIVVYGQGRSGYISIDCGIPPYDTPEDTMAKINYVSDDAFITTGVNFNVSEEYGALSNPVLPSTLAEVRAFPQGNRNCYTLKTFQGKGNRYLIRAWFMYGNYDGKKALPEFDLYVNVNFWSTVKFKDASDQIIKEILSFAESETIYVCLVNKGKGTPFISGLELRPVNSSIYGTEFGRNVSLVLYRRWDIGYLNGTGRYQDDRFDRIWSPYSSNISWNSIVTSAYIDVFQNGYAPPDEVIKTAASPKSDDDPLELLWTSDDPNSRFYAYLYFAELEALEKNETRKINILWNGSPFSETSFVPSSKYSMTFSNPRAFTGNDHLISLQKTTDSTLPPILNAIEIFTVQSLDEFYTRTDDVHAIESIKETYKVNKVWSGDPCSPRLFPWEGIGCSYSTNSYHQIKSLNLSSSGLQGPIVLTFRNLSLLESLDLSNNDLQQNVPEFLADMKYLKLLNLKGNNFTGVIPNSLIKRLKAGLLALSVDDQNLCNSGSCQDKKKNNMVVPIAVATSVIVLIVVLVIIWIILRQRKKGAYIGPLLPSGKRRFTYNELSRITNNFNQVIGKGGFGIVYLGSLENGTKIAVKMINDSSLGKPKESLSSRASNQFQVEAELLLTVHHRNLASFVGYCDDDRSMALIYEYMANGNLQDYLSSENAEDLSWEKRLHIAIDSAQGLEYLHDGCRPPIVHRDVKTANILLNDNLEAKIADFGLSKVFPEDDLSHAVTTVMGTPGYIDPEHYRTFVLNEKSDVFSFGIVLLELITGQRAIIKTEEGDNISVVDYVWPFFEARELDGIVDPLLRGDFSEDSAWKFVEVAMSCVRERGSSRPTMNQIVTELKQCLAAELDREPQSH
ncbi:PREDICTED: probable LRR receptor-like serine/threonine-protein kinase At4g29180 [Camelina sativa]|uniref:non-specific serine/threonine protein kinase n=1 Tax=Camelina sativa TaxID=90675 RepID=A0ABM0UAG5_CAMSA|nr:PREDICTED: probable LRR receptor-like serine/threonine-protein kinase At4g29180 [Camelina sativa]